MQRVYHGLRDLYNENNKNWQYYVQVNKCNDEVVKLKQLNKIISNYFKNSFLTELNNMTQNKIDSILVEENLFYLREMFNMNK